MNVVEPSDMFEYISRHFKAYNFDNMESIQAKSLYVNKSRGEQFLWNRK